MSLETFTFAFSIFNIGDSGPKAQHAPFSCFSLKSSTLLFAIVNMSAIKAKLTELGCYVDDELPDYVMVMVANKRTRAQMEDDLQLFLGDNTELFVNWLHQVLKKLQEVTVTPLKSADIEKHKEKSKEKKSKDKKDKGKMKKLEGVKKSKKKDKEKSHRKKEREEKKAHKSKKKSKHEMIRPNIPPLLMNIEKDSEPSITDVFAGQILKNHGINIDTPIPNKQIDKKPVITELKRPILPIIDPATISSQPEPISLNEQSTQELNRSSISSIGAPREEQIKEINEIEAKIQGLKQKLAEQLDSMSDDEDFLNIRTEAEELMNDFAEDVFQEISSQAPVATPPLTAKKSPSPPKVVSKPPEIPKEIPETLPQIELKLPKRPIRERLGAKEETMKVAEVKEKEIDKRTESPERFTPEREPDFWPKSKSARSRLGDAPEPTKKMSVSDDSSNKSDSNSKRLTSKISTLESRPLASCASVVRVRPRPRVGAPASSLLLRAVADAHKSLLNIPPKVDPEPQKVKRALVLPMRRCVDAQKIVIQVPAEDRPTHGDGGGGGEDITSKLTTEIDNGKEYVPASITKKIHNADYVPSRRTERTSSRRDDTLIIETINIHNTTVDKDKDTQFIVTMDGFNPNAFLAKKLMTEGLLNDEEETTLKPTQKKIIEKKVTEPVLKSNTEKTKENDEKEETKSEISQEVTKTSSVQKKRLSDTSEESETQVIIRKENDAEETKDVEVKSEETAESPPTKKRKASPIVFDVGKKEKEKICEKEPAPERERERTDSMSSDNHVTVTTTINKHKYDAVPPLSQAERKLVWCRSFPLCRYGAACAFQHPRCKFAAACTRRNCVYSHAHARPASTTGPVPAPVPVPLPAPVLASHVVPAANFKSISSTVLPSICKFYPNCVNPACHFYHPKPCRYGKACANKLECNFYHNDVPAGKWRYPV